MRTEEEEEATQEAVIQADIGEVPTGMPAVNGLQLRYHDTVRWLLLLPSLFR